MQVPDDVSHASHLRGDPAHEIGVVHPRVDDGGTVPAQLRHQAEQGVEARTSREHVHARHLDAQVLDPLGDQTTVDEREDPDFDVVRAKAQHLGEERLSAADLEAGYHDCDSHRLAAPIVLTDFPSLRSRPRSSHPQQCFDKGVRADAATRLTRF